MILLVDNYDSFTWNLYQQMAGLGAEVEVVRNDVHDVGGFLALGAQAVVLSPGPGRPADAGVCPELIARLDPAVPLLGVCLGHQAIGQVYGGEVVRAGKLMHGKTSPVHHRDTDVFRGLPAPFDATRYHSLVIAEDSVPDALEVTAWCDDPAGRTIMGIAHRQHPTWGVQFHPESILTRSGMSLLANFLRLVEHHHA